VPVIASVGHHTDRTLIDDVAAVSCSTPTHAAEAAVPVDCAHARTALASHAQRLERLGRRATVERARVLVRLARAPAEHVARHRARLHQQLRELRASARRGRAERARATAGRAIALERRADAAGAARARGAGRATADGAAVQRAAASALARRGTDLERLAIALAAHDPQRTLERGYALVEDPAGAPITSAAAAREHAAVTVRWHDGRGRFRPDAPLSWEGP
jgi:exodeoxyribonuclease VII large subunit